MPRQRDHQADYKRRIERALAKGLSRAQARGHARFGEAGLTSRPGPQSDDRLESALKRLRAGKALDQTATEFRISRERLSRYIKIHAGAERSHGRWIFNDQRRRTVEFFAVGHTQPVITDVIGYEPARLAGQHWDEAHEVLADHDLLPAFARKWEGVTIRDANGVRFALSTDPNEIYRAAHATERPFDEIYRLVT
jgi:hypothetical protein